MLWPSLGHRKWHLRRNKNILQDTLEYNRPQACSSSVATLGHKNTLMAAFWHKNTLEAALWHKNTVAAMRH